MALISDFVQAVRSAIYGEEVRGSIADALNAMNNESENALRIASGIDAKYQQILTLVSSSDQRATQAMSIAHDAQVLSESTREVAAQAKTESAAAVANSSAAVRDSTNALTKATNAKETAEGIEWKAVQALNIATDCQKLNTDAKAIAENAFAIATEVKLVVDNFGDYHIKLPIYDAEGNPILDADGNQIEGLVRVLVR